MSAGDGRQIKARIGRMAAGQPADVKRLKGVPGYRLRVGRYRVIFERRDDTIVIIDVRHRGSTY